MLDNKSLYRQDVAGMRHNRGIDGCAGCLLSCAAIRQRNTAFTHHYGILNFGAIRLPGMGKAMHAEQEQAQAANRKGKLWRAFFMAYTAPGMDMPCAD